MFTYICGLVAAVLVSSCTETPIQPETPDTSGTEETPVEPTPEPEPEPTPEEETEEPVE